MQNLLLKTLSDPEVAQIHQSTLEVLETTGFKLTHPEALRRMEKAGAQVDHAGALVRIPRKLVQELLAQAPAMARETGLNGKKMEVGGANRYYLSLIVDPFIADYTAGIRRPVLEDIRRHTIIGESLNRVSSMMRMEFPVSDVPGPDSYYKTMEVFLCHTTKHTAIYPTSAENCRDWMEVMEVIADAAGLDLRQTPLASLGMAVTSPLQLHGPNVEMMKMAIEHNFPITSTVCPMAGTTAPYSVAGTALISNVESLIPVLVAQVYKPGQAVLYAFGPSATDMRSGHDLYYKAEKMLFKIIACQMGKYYNLPIAGEAGGSLTHRADVQNGAESMAYLLASHAGGQNIIGGLGSLYNANGMSAEQIIMQCGLVDMAEYLAKGVEVSEAKLAVESIARAGAGGNYLTDDLTLELLHSSEFFDSEHFDMSSGYEGAGQGMYEKAHEKAEQLVSEYRPTVPEKVQAAIKRYCQSKYQDPRLADL